MNTEAPPATQPAISRLTKDDPFLARVQEVRQSIVRRAYDLFKESGFGNREDLEEWNRVVSELLLQVPLAIADKDDEIIVLAEVPGYTEQDIEVKVDSNRVFIAGSIDLPSECESEKDESLCAEQSSREFLSEYPLPAPVDPDRVSAELKDGVLEIRLAKCAERKCAGSAEPLAASSAA